MIKDITEQKKTERLIKESEERFKQLANATFEGIAIHDNGMILEINDEMAVMLGYAKQDLIQKSLMNFILPEESARINGNIKSNSENSFKTVMVARDGSRKDVEIHTKPIVFKSRNVMVAAIRKINQD